MSITVIRPGLQTTVQDFGRYGYQKYGIIVSGAMDIDSLRIANLLVGNDEGEAALEIALRGPTLRFETDVIVAIAGANLTPTVNGSLVPLRRPVYLKAGSILTFGACQSGCRAYLAVAGGYRLPSVMGSKSTYLRAGIGGFQGRALQAGDVLELNTPTEQSSLFRNCFTRRQPNDSYTAPTWYVGQEHVKKTTDPVTVRVMHGGQFEHFAAESIEQFWSSPFQVTPQSDRMGYRLSGPALQLTSPLEMLSEAVAIGTIQVPPDGNPIILMADRQTTGGYPKIGQVAQVDISKIAQQKPGETIRFQNISVVEAQRLYNKREQELHSLRVAIRLALS